jgi:ferredoxin
MSGGLFLRRREYAIHPDECIDCGVCEPECPVDAIKPDTEPGLEKWLDINAKYSLVWPNITVKREPPPRNGRASLTRSTCYRQTLARVIETWTAHMWLRA